MFDINSLIELNIIVASKVIFQYEYLMFFGQKKRKGDNEEGLQSSEDRHAIKNYTQTEFFL